MDTIVILAMLGSALLHALWNYLLKRAKHPKLFISLSKILEAVIFFIPFWLVFQQHQVSGKQLSIIVIAAVLVFFSYYFLALAYQYLDMSLAYPISRSSTLFLPFLAWIFLNESIDMIGLIALLCITLGVILLSNSKRTKVLTDDKTVHYKGLLFALAVAFISALQTLWSKISISQIQPFIFFYCYTFFVAFGFFINLTIKSMFTKNLEHCATNNDQYSTTDSIMISPSEILLYLKSYWLTISLVAIFNTVSYLLFLYALGKANTSYVGSLRQLSLVIVLFLSYWLLKEILSKQKLIGTAIVILGSILVTFAQ